MLKKRFTMILLCGVLLLYSSSAALAAPIDGGETEALPDPADIEFRILPVEDGWVEDGWEVPTKENGVVRGHEGNSASPVMGLHAEVDRQLFGQHAVLIKEQGIYITHTSPLENKIEVGIDDYSEAAASFLYELIGKDKIVVVKGERAYTLDGEMSIMPVFDDGREPAIYPEPDIDAREPAIYPEPDIGVSEPGILPAPDHGDVTIQPAPMPFPQDIDPDTPVSSDNGTDLGPIPPGGGMDGNTGSSGTIEPGVAPGSPEIATDDERLAAEQSQQFADDIAAVSEGDAAAEHASADIVSAPQESTLANTTLYSTILIIVIIAGLAALLWLFRDRIIKNNK